MTDTRSSQSHSTGKIHPLTAMRFFAALFVVMFHTIWFFFPSIKPHEGLGRVFSLGYISVSFFFLLSGYILAFVYLRSGKSVSSKGFYRARFARVYPLLFLTLALDTPFLFLDKFHSYGLRGAIYKVPAVFAGSALLLQAWTPRFKAINSPSWSLSVEAVFYLLFPLLGPALWKLRGARLWLSAAILYFGGQILVLLASLHMSLDFCERLPLLHLSTFALGILLARWQTLAQVQSLAGGISTGTSNTAIFSVSACIFAAVVCLSPSSVRIGDTLCDGLLAPVFAGFIWSLSSPGFAPAKLLSAPWLVILGEASFGLYLFHSPMMHLFSYLGLVRGPVLFAIYLSASVGVSVLSFYFFETPVRQRILKGRRMRAPETIELASDAQ